MDSLSHALLGAMLGQVGPARRAGNRALLAGAAIAWIPDIDVAIGYGLSDAAALTFHRGITHSIVFALCLSPLLGLVLHRLDAHRSASRTQWTLLAAMVLASHLALDSLTSYGIQLLQPFSAHSFAVASVSVIDPLYTLPLLVAALVIPWLRHTSRHRLTLAATALIVSSGYLASTLYYQHHATRQIQAGFAAAGIEVERLFVKPTLFNAVLWRGIAASGDGYYVTFHSRRDSAPPDDFIYFSRNDALLSEYRHEEVIQDLIAVSDGYYQVVSENGELDEENGELLFRDLRYGQAFEWLRDDRPHVFTYRLLAADDKPLTLEALTLQRHPERDRATFTALMERARGH